MRIVFKRIFNWYSERNVFVLVTINFIVLTGLNFLIAQLVSGQSLENKTVELLKKESVFYAFFMIVIFGPLIETLIFQTAVIRTILFFFEKYRKLAVFVSASLFSIIHIYSAVYVIFGFFAGLIFACTYLISLKRRQNPLLVVWVLHALCNFIPFMLDFCK